MRVGLLLRSRPSLSRNAAVLIGSLLLVAALLLLAFVVSQAAAIGPSTPLDRELLAPFRWSGQVPTA